MYILSIDTTAKTAAASLSVADDMGVFPLCDARLNSTLTHSESILPMIDFCLKSANVSLSEVDTFAITTGPGSFTGVRIGVSTIKGLTFGNDNVKCIGVSSLEALCENVSDMPKGTIICACMDARRNQFYNAIFSSDGKAHPALHALSKVMFEIKTHCTYRISCNIFFLRMDVFGRKQYLHTGQL